MLAWNRKEDVRESLTRIAEIEYDNYEVIVVDNASTDGTQELVKTEFPHVNLIEMSENVGIKAYNVGFEQAKGDYIIIIDDDSFPAKTAMRRMVKAFEQDPQLGVCAFDVRNYYNYDDINQDIDNDEGVKAVPRDYYMGFNGAGVGVRKDVFKQI
ncbi:nucleotide-diphospho-sugar transferase, partial [Rhizophagus irregularis]